MKAIFRNILIVSVVLGLNAAPVALYAMPEPVPATQTDKQKAAEKKKKERPGSVRDPGRIRLLVSPASAARWRR